MTPTPAAPATESTPVPAPKEERLRDAGIDAVRGFLILCVVLGHLPLGTFLGTQPAWWVWLNESIYLFHVPLFFALTCLLTGGRNWRDLVRGILPIVVPYVLWFAWQQHAVLRQHPVVWMKWLAVGNFATLQSILWFLPALVTVRLISPVVHQSLARPTWLVAITGIWFAVFSQVPWLAQVHGSIPFGLDIAVLCLPYFAALVFVHREQVRLTAIPSIAWFLLALGLTCWVYATEPLKTHTPWHKRVDLAQLSLPHTLLGYLAWVLQGCAWYLALRRAVWAPLVSLGRHSLPVFLIHYEIIKWFIVDPQRLPGGPGVAAVLLIIGLAIGVPWGVSYGLRRLWSGARWIGF